MLKPKSWQLNKAFQRYKKRSGQALVKCMNMKLSIKYFLFLLFFVGFELTGSAQDSGIVKIQKFKPPAVNTYLGVNTNGAAVTVDEASQLIGLPLKVTDDKKNTYTIESYGFLYKRKGVIEDEKTGLRQTTFTNVADNFTSTPLPKVWIDNLKSGFQKDEQMYFFDILVKDSKNRKFYAPDLKIAIK